MSEAGIRQLEASDLKDLFVCAEMTTARRRPPPHYRHQVLVDAGGMIRMYFDEVEPGDGSDGASRHTGRYWKTWTTIAAMSRRFDRWGRQYRRNPTGRPDAWMFLDWYKVRRAVTIARKPRKAVA